MGIEPNGYWTKWVLNQMGLDQMGLDQMAINQQLQGHILGALGPQPPEVTKGCQKNEEKDRERREKRKKRERKGK